MIGLLILLVSVLQHSLLLTEVGAALESGVSKSEEFVWTDFNFVPCENMGINATGRMKLRVEAVARNDSANPPLREDANRYIDLSSVSLLTRYNFPHRASITIYYQDWETGETKKIYLVEPWYDTMTSGDAHERVYIGPRSTEANAALRKQKSFRARYNGKFKLQAAVTFSQDGGTCIATFSEKFELDVGSSD